MIARFIIGAIALAGCQSATVHDSGEITRPNDTNVIYVSENYGGFAADSGDTVIVIMYLDGNDPAPRCDDMGGKFHYDHEIGYCVDIDF